MRFKLSGFIVISTVLLSSACSDLTDKTSPYDQIAKDYISINFRLEKHIPGQVDAYFGPENLRAVIEAEDIIPIEEIIDQIDGLINRLSQVDTEIDRRDFLRKQLIALKTLSRIQSGEKLSFLEETALIYDIKPKKTPESQYQIALDTIDRLLPGNGTIAERLEKYQQTLIMPADKVIPVFSRAAELARERTKELFQLPENESFDLELVTDKPWSGYNWFKGNSYSLIQLNVDLPRRIDQALPLMTHEGYPGHHTELTLKEKILFKERGYLEYSIYPLFSPQSVISEGIAELAAEILFSNDEIMDFVQNEFAPEIGLENFDFEKLKQIKSALKQLRSIGGNAAIMLFEENRSEEEVYQYIRKYGLIDKDYARKRIEFIKINRGYIFTYYYGYDLLGAYLEGKDKRAEFKSIVSAHAYPSQFFN